MGIQRLLTPSCFRVGFTKWNSTALPSHGEKFSGLRVLPFSFSGSRGHFSSPPSFPTAGSLNPFNYLLIFISLGGILSGPYLAPARRHKSFCLCPPPSWGSEINLGVTKEWNGMQQAPSRSFRVFLFSGSGVSVTCVHQLISTSFACFMSYLGVGIIL